MMKIITNLKSRSNVLMESAHVVEVRDAAHASKKPVVWTGALSLIKVAMGNPVIHMSSPIRRKLQAVPSLSTMTDIASEITAPPKPPLAKTSPLARPRRFEKYCDVSTDATMKQQLTPYPMVKPAVMNRPATDFWENPLSICPEPMSARPR
jgi:hypothetical protein